MTWFRQHYGAGPLHLLSLLACFALAGYVASQVAQVPEAARVGVWFVGAAIGHDLLLWPLYTLVDRSAVRVARRDPGRLPKVSWINHVRAPAIISGMLLAVSFPLVFKLSEPTYRNATGLTQSPYLDRWLLVTGILFAASACLYALRLGRAVRQDRSGGSK